MCIKYLIFKELFETQEAFWTILDKYYTAICRQIFLRSATDKRSKVILLIHFNPLKYVGGGPQNFNIIYVLCPNRIPL